MAEGPDPRGADAESAGPPPLRAFLGYFLRLGTFGFGGPIALAGYMQRDLVGGLAGAVAAAIGVFLPCYLFVVIPAPFYRRFAGNRSLEAFVDGVTAAATGAIAGAAFVLGRRAIVDIPTVLIAAATLGLLVRFKKAPEPLVILAAGALGILIREVWPS